MTARIPCKKPAFFIAALLCLPLARVPADTVTYFGDFEDIFGSTGAIYDSSVAYDPGSFIGLASEKVIGIPKFAPGMGTLTGIEIFVDPGEAILYMVSGDMTITEVDGTVPEGYSASIGLVAEAQLNYFGTGSAADFTVFGDIIPLEGSDAGAMGTGETTTPIVMIPPADATLTGSASVIGDVDLDDFVGAGMVDSLFVDLLIQDTADFALMNSTATAKIDWDLFDGDSGADDPVIGVTYTFTAIPEPTSGVALLAVACGLCLRRRRSS